MTLPDERKNAVQAAQEFLRQLLDPAQTPRVPRAIRREARARLKHYPGAFDLEGWDGSPIRKSTKTKDL